MSKKMGDQKAVIEQVRSMLDAGEIREAMDFLALNQDGSATLRNAVGVCLLRLGQREQAITRFREIVYRQGSYMMSDDVPVSVKVNFALSLLLTNRIHAGLQILREIGNDPHPSVKSLHSAVAEWKRSLGAVHRILFLLGWDPGTPLKLLSPPGEL